MLDLIIKYLSSKQQNKSIINKIIGLFKSSTHELQYPIEWFRDHQADALNREILRHIIEHPMPELHQNLVSMVSNMNLAYSDPQAITNVVIYVDNAMNAQRSSIHQYYRSINLPQITADLIFIAFRLLINEAIRISNEKHNEMRKALGGLEKWMDNIKEQFIFIRDSDQQSRQFSDDFLNQLFEEIMKNIKEIVNEEIRKKIIGNSHIDPEKIARNAYDSSIGSSPSNHDRIMKYILDINRYYIELALENVELSDGHIVNSQILKLQKLVSNCIDTAIEVVKNHECRNVQQFIDRLLKLYKVFYQISKWIILLEFR